MNRKIKWGQVTFGDQKGLSPDVLKETSRKKPSTIRNA